MTNQIKALSIRELFSNGTYSIPIYQRNYAWSMDQVEQLIQDVANAARNGQNNYYIGNLIVDRHPEEEFETIDGQQRMTTLFLLHWYNFNYALLVLPFIGNMSILFWYSR